MKKLLFGALILCLTSILFITCKKDNKDDGSTTPTCYDGIKNGNETGIDCGGNCPACTGTTTCNAATGLNSVNVTTSSAALNWTAASGASGYSLNYRIKGSSSWTTVSGVLSGYNLSGLSAGTQYEWMIQASCSSGSPASSSISGFTTTGTSGCNTPGSLNVTGVTQTNATLTWSAVSGATSYTVKYSTVSPVSWITVSPSPTSNTANLSGLSASTSYQWQVSAVCSAGNSSAATANFSTASPPSCSVPTSCANGVQDAGETGRDCGGSSCNACPASAAGEVKAIMDGCLWVGTSYSVYYRPASIQFIFDISSTSPAGSSIQLTTASDPASNVTLDMVMPYAKFYTNASSLYEKTNANGLTAIIKFSKFDTTNKKMSGTFYITGANSGGAKKYVSSGTFTDIPFTITP